MDIANNPRHIVVFISDRKWDYILQSYTFAVYKMGNGILLKKESKGKEFLQMINDFAVKTKWNRDL